MHPLDLVKTRFQLQSAIPVHGQVHWSNIKIKSVFDQMLKTIFTPGINRKVFFWLLRSSTVQPFPCYAFEWSKGLKFQFSLFMFNPKKWNMTIGGIFPFNIFSLPTICRITKNSSLIFCCLQNNWLSQCELNVFLLASLHVDRALHEDDVPHGGSFFFLERNFAAALCRDTEESLESRWPL